MTAPTKTMQSRNQVRKLRLAQPKSTQYQIAQQIGISRERVRQLLKDMELPTRRPTNPVRYCPRCKDPIPKERHKNTHCSQKCYAASCQVTLTCDTCNNQYQVLQRTLTAKIKKNHQYCFCSVTCRTQKVPRNNRKNTPLGNQTFKSIAQS